MTDKGARMIMIGLLALAAAYFLTHLHEATTPGEGIGVFVTNTITGTTTSCGPEACVVLPVKPAPRE